MDAAGAIVLAVATAIGPGRCPPPEQPMLSQALVGMIEAGRPADALDCLRDIQQNTDLGGLTDEVRYQLGLLAAEAIARLNRGSPPLASDARDAAELWDAYLASVSQPYDPVRINTALKQLVQYGRFGDFGAHLSTLMRGVGKVRSGLRPEVADLLLSTLRRCPTWDRVSTRLACTRECKAMAESALESLETEMRDSPPWTGSEGLGRLSASAIGLKKEVASCRP